MNERQAAVEALQIALGYRFVDPAVLDEALTHASISQGSKRIANNERLEFLGDRLLNLLVAEQLMKTRPFDSEGDLSKRLHVLVSRDACAAVARSVNVGRALRLPGGETRRGARDQDTVLADAMEAILAAIYRDAGLDRLREVFLSLWSGPFLQMDQIGFGNPKSELQEWAAANKFPPPRYEVNGRSGPDHAPTFSVTVHLDGFVPETAVGRSRQEAEKAAAKAWLKREILR